MKHRAVMSLAVAATLMIVGVGMLACAETAAQRPDLTGQWRLDPKRSDTTKPPGEGQRRGGGSGGGFGGGPPGGGSGGGPPDMDESGSSRSSSESGRGGGAPPRPLPDLMHVTDSERIISFEDSTGTVLQEITVTASESEADTLTHAPGAQVFIGQWKDAKLEARRSGRGNLKITQNLTFAGDTVLVIRTKMSGSDRMPANEFKRFYRRVKSD